MNPGVVGALMLLVSLSAWAGPDPLKFPGHGFTIAPLEGTADSGNVQPLIMRLPPTEGFAPNVNVMVQTYDGTMKDYAKLSEGQFKSMKMKVLDRSLTEDSVFWEYVGPYSSGRMHWYARAFLGEGRVYLATATALEAQWDEVGDQLKACVDSFGLTGDR